MKRPVPYILLFIVMGIIAGRYAENIMHIALFMLCVAAAAYMLARFYKIKLPAFLPIIAIAGYIVCFASGTVKPELKALEGKTVSACGSVLSVSSGDKNNCCIVDTSLIEYRGRYYKVNEKIRAYTDKKAEIGDRVVFECKLKSVEGKTNPSDFDRKAYMLARGQHYSVYAQKLDTAGRTANINTALQRLRQRVSGVYYKVLPQRQAGLICAMLLGETGDIDEDLSQLYKRTGIYHVIAISGLHITLLGTLVLKLFSRFGKRTAALAAALILGCYCLLTGCSVSAVRAVFMFYVMLLGSFIFRDYDIISSAALSACCMLLYRPYMLFDAGFQLSYLAVLSIGAAADIMLEYKKTGYMAQTVGVSLAVDMALKPVLMHHFGYISPWSIAANLLLVPMMTAAVGLGFATAAVGLVSITAAQIIALPVYVILCSVEVWCNMLSSLPFSYIVTGRPPLALAAVYGLVLLSGYLLVMKGSKRGFVLSLSALAAVMCTVLVCDVYKKPHITFLNVGQGDCAVGIDRDYCFVVDGGNVGKGRGVLLPYLMYSGVDRVSAVFVSHTDSDHIGGIIEIMGSVPVDTIYMPFGYEDSENGIALARLAKENGTRVITMSAGTAAVIDERTKMECIYPYKDTGLDGNNISMVNRLVSNNYSVLFTGDVESKAEELICANNANVKADVLKLAHHGSSTSNSVELLDRVSPLAAVASAEKSAYGHPDDEVLERLDTKNIPYYITENDGAITVEPAADGIYIKTFLQRRKTDE